MVFSTSIKSSSAKMAGVLLLPLLTVGRLTPKKEVVTLAAMLLRLLRLLLLLTSLSDDVEPS